MATPTAIVAYLALFAVVGFLFLFVNLIVGWLVRPDDPHAEKKEIYECGEPAIGSSFVQFDLRFYVVALVFIVFDAEVAFLFPVSTVFGKQTQLADLQAAGLPPEAAAGLYQELGVATPSPPATEQEVLRFTWYVYAATMLFFFVLFVGFAYEWKTGAFDWVRAVQEARQPPAPPPSLRLAGTGTEPVLSS